MSWLAKLLVVGAVVEAAVAISAAVSAFPLGLVAALIGSSIALAAQVAAVSVLRPKMGAETPQFVRSWASGIGIRGASLVVVAALIVALKAVLPVIWLAIGYLVVMLTLLYAETRFLK